MRNLYLVSYDVCDPKRLRAIFKKMHGFGDPVQYSVFLCPLSAKERILLLEAIGRIIHHTEDRVMIVNLGPQDGRGDECIEFLGRKMELPESGAAVV